MMWRALLLILPILIHPLPSSAGEPTAADSPAAVEDSEAKQIEAWRERLQEARERLENARARADAASYAYRDGRQRERRGDAKAELLAAKESAEAELAAAEAALPELLEKARRAGVPPGVLREFED